MTGGQLLETGWHRVYPFSEAKEVVLPAFETGEHLPVQHVTLDEKETQPPARYTQSKLIQRMEELGLGTKSTRHEVIAKLVSRKYVEGNPLRPTLVGRVVTESLEQHADAITRQDMTQMLEAHMQQIKESKRTREDVVRESREMLHRAFDQLEANEQVIGEDIRGKTAEEMNLGKCPACGGTLAIKHLRGNTQFIGCSRYPDCTVQYRAPDGPVGVCSPDRRSVRKTPSQLCPACAEGGPPLGDRLSTLSPYQLQPRVACRDPVHGRSPGKKDPVTPYLFRCRTGAQHPGSTCKETGTRQRPGEELVHGAGLVLEKLRKRSECRKFMRDNLIPRKGRSYSKILTALRESGISEFSGLARADIATLKKAGIGESESEQLLTRARTVYHGQVLREIGIPAVSLKKYLAAGIIDPEAFCARTPGALSDLTCMSVSTVQRHVELVCRYLNKPVPKKISKIQMERGKKGAAGHQRTGRACS